MALRRQEVRLSQAQAAARAKVARNTWATAENGSRVIREHNYAGIEEALSWAPGSINAVLAGGDPSPLDPPGRPPSGRSAPGGLPDEIDRISRLDLPAETRIQLIRRLVDLYEEAQQEAGAAQQPPG